MLWRNCHFLQANSRHEAFVMCIQSHFCFLSHLLDYCLITLDMQSFANTKAGKQRICNPVRNSGNREPYRSDRVFVKLSLRSFSGSLSLALPGSLWLSQALTLWLSLLVTCFENGEKDCNMDFCTLCQNSTLFQLLLSCSGRDIHVNCSDYTSSAVIQYR